MVAEKEAWIEHIEDFADELLHCDSKYTYIQSAFDINYSGGCVKTYKKLVVRINTSNDFSSINPLNITIGDSNEEWVLHSFLVYRGGKVIDKTTSISFSELQRETSLEENVITGTKTFIAHIDDLKIGDIISCEHTVTSTNPIHSERFEYILQTTFAVPLYQFRLRVYYDNHLSQCAYRVYNGFQEVKRGYIDDSGIFRYNHTEIDAVILEDNIPYHRSPFAHIEFSDYKDWSELGMTISKFYQSDEYNTQYIRDYAQSLVADCESAQQSLETLVEHVQKNIGYLSLSLNEHSYVPHSPHTVAKNNYGDCKDKTMLLKTLLKTQGIESTPVLVHTTFSKNVPNRLPSLGCFNHVILSIEFEGSKYLADPTNSYDCFTIANCAEPSFESGLYLGDKPDLVIFTEKKNSIFLREIVERYTIKGNSATLLVSDEYSYLAFSGMAHRQTVVNKDSLKKTYIDYYSKQFPSVKFDDSEGDGMEYTTNIDFERHTITVTTKFLIPALWENTDSNDNNVKQAVFFPGDLMEVIQKLSGTGRRFPFSFSHPVECRISYIIDYDFSTPMGSLNDAIDNDIFSYSVITTDKWQTFTYKILYKSKTDVIEAENYAASQKTINQFINKLGFYVTRPNEAIEETTGNSKGGMSIGMIILIIWGILTLLRLLL